MGGFDALPSVNTILEQASVWAVPLWYEFNWVIAFVFGIVCLVGAIKFLGNLLEMFRDAYDSNKPEAKYNQARQDIIDYIKKNEQLDKDYALYLKAQKYK